MLCASSPLMLRLCSEANIFGSLCDSHDSKMNMISDIIVDRVSGFSVTPMLL